MPARRPATARGVASNTGSLSLEATFRTPRTPGFDPLIVEGLTGETMALATVATVAALVEDNFRVARLMTPEEVAQYNAAIPRVGTAPGEADVSAEPSVVSLGLKIGLLPVAAGSAILSALRKLTATTPPVIDVRPYPAERAKSPLEELTKDIERLASRVGIARLRYESPLEIALIIPPAVYASKVALPALIFAVKRMYGIDLELRTHREEQRAAFLIAKRRADAMQRALSEGREPESWTPGTLEGLSELLDEARPGLGIAGLRLEALVLVERGVNNEDDSSSKPERDG
jgi:hypothetical protein